MKPKTLLNQNVKGEAVSSPAPKIKREEIHVETKNPLIITATEIVKLLNISHGTFTKWLREGRFEGVRMMKREKGANYKFCKADFEKWLNNSLFS